MYISTLPKTCSSVGISALMEENELPIFYGMDVANETTASSYLHCSRQCLQSGCVGFLFKTNDDVDDNHCYTTPSHYGYNGTVAVTINGNICQHWVDQTPHAHDQIPDRMPESSLADAKNYCRDPDGEGFNWCYTTNSSVRFEACDTYPCFRKSYNVDNNQCYSTPTHFGYDGTVAVTTNGYTCQNWIDQTPHAHGQVADQMPESSLADAKNYCRDPDGEGFNWCYTTNPSVRFEECDTYPCTSGNNRCRLFSTRNNKSGNRNVEGYRLFNRTSYN
ncbi:hypothetical protein ACF0H5_021616 [Mactra antiquata]